jgi:hypothetical protein
MKNQKQVSKNIPTYAVKINQVLEAFDKAFDEHNALKWEQYNLEKDQDIKTLRSKQPVECSEEHGRLLDIEAGLIKKGRETWSAQELKEYNTAVNARVYMERGEARWRRDLAERIGPLRLLAANSIDERLAAAYREKGKNQSALVGLLKTVEARRYAVTRGCQFKDVSGQRVLVYKGEEFNI